MIDSFSARRKCNGGLLLGLLTLNTFVAGATIPTSPGGVSDLLEGFLDLFKASTPAVTQAGIGLYSKLLGSPFTTPYTTPQQSTSRFTRSLNLALVRTTFLYGPPLGGGPSFPTGLLGAAKVAEDAANIQLDLVPELAAAAVDLAKAALDSPKVRQT